MAFRYARDPLFRFCFALYFVNALVLKPNFNHQFLHNWLNDLICIPFWLPLMLLIMRKCGARHDDAPPRATEIVVPLLIWSWVFEFLLPEIALFQNKVVADFNDILFYAIGAAFSSMFWSIFYRQRQQKLTV